MQAFNAILDNFAVFTAVVGVSLFVIVGIWSTVAWRKENALRAQREQTRNAERAARARNLGWRYESVPEGDIRFRFHGELADGSPWQIYFDLDARSSSSSPKLIFLAEQKRSTKPRIYIGDEANYQVMRAGIGRKLLGAATMMLDGLSGGKLAEMVEFYDRAVTRKEGGWIVAATEAHLLSAPGLVNALDLLQHWPANMQGRKPDSKNVQAWQDKNGLRVELQGEYTDIAVCVHLHRIGSQLAAGVGSHLS